MNSGYILCQVKSCCLLSENRLNRFILCFGISQLIRHFPTLEKSYSPPLPSPRHFFYLLISAPRTEIDDCVDARLEMLSLGHFSGCITSLCWCASFSCSRDSPGTSCACYCDNIWDVPQVLETLATPGARAAGKEHSVSFSRDWEMKRAGSQDLIDKRQQRQQQVEQIVVDVVRTRE